MRCGFVRGFGAGISLTNRLSPLKVRLHWLEIEINPTLQILQAICRKIRMAYGHSRPTGVWFEEYFKPRVFVGRLELRGPPGLEYPFPGFQLEVSAVDVAIPGGETVSNLWANLCRTSRHSRVSLRIKPRIIDLPW